MYKLIIKEGWYYQWLGICYYFTWNDQGKSQWELIFEQKKWMNEFKLELYWYNMRQTTYNLNVKQNRIPSNKGHFH